MDSRGPHPPTTLFPDTTTLVDLLAWRAQHQPERRGYAFLGSGDTHEHFTYADVDYHARAIASRLQQIGAVGERVLLLYSPGIEYLTAFFGCLYAGAIAVPVYPPRRNRPSPRLAAIVDDSRAKFVLTDGKTFAEAERLCLHTPVLASLHWIATDDLREDEAAAWAKPAVAADTHAFLQYTSGSTSTPKGVVLSHSNLIHNSALIQNAFGTTTESRGVIWLPPYHDMGLIGGILQPLYTGFPVVLMAPMAFLQQPYAWLEAISRFGADASGGPNFAYALCVEKITPAQRETLDLSRWRVAFNGAEPIRTETLAKFAETFADCGFRYEAFYPCYGLAEGTLIVAGGDHNADPIVHSVDETALALNRVIITDSGAAGSRALVGSGQALGDQRIVIAHPETGETCAPDEVGEIWVAGPSIAQGYWGQPESTTRTFRAHLADSGEGPFLRTGDLGFLYNGELFVTGRLKDLIIIRGRNYYPQDIELTTEQSHPALRPGNGATFAVEVNGEEQLVVAQEIHSHARHALNVEEVAEAVRRAVAEQHELQVHAVLLLRTGTIPKTSSGKIQRHAVRHGWQEETLSLVGSSTRTEAVSEPIAASPIEDESPLAYLQREATRILRQSLNASDVALPLHRLGLDSLAAVEMGQAIEARYGYTVSMVELLEGITLQGLAGAIEVWLQRPADVDTTAELLTSDGAATPDYFALSAPQQRLWFLERLNAGNAAYHIPVAVEIRGQLNIKALQASFDAIIERHEPLRTIFTQMNGVPVQRIVAPFGLDIPVVEIQGDASALATELHRRATTDAHQPFELTQGPLLRSTLLRRSDDHHVLLLTFHHIITDGWSMGVLAREVSTLYQAFLQGQPSPFAPLSFHYRDVATWQNAPLHNGTVAEPLRRYWVQQLAGMPPLLELPTDYPRPATQTFNGAQVIFDLPPALRNALQQTATANDATLFMALLAALKVLFRAHTGREDIVVGTSVANRQHRASSALIGFFVNQLVLRTPLTEANTFQHVLERVRRTTLSAFKHQTLPFDKVVEVVRAERNPRYNPLFQTNFVFENAPLPALTFAGLELTVLDVESHAAPFDLSLLVSENGEGLKAIFRYNRDLFAHETIMQWAVQYQAIAAAVAAQPSAPLTDLLAALGIAAKRTNSAPRTVVREKTGVPAPQNVTVHQLFAEQAQRTPTAPAIVTPRGQFNFAELDARANQLAHHLLTLGVAPESRVGLCLTRSTAMMVGLLGILKAGGAYVPLDPTYPPARLAFLIEDARLEVIVTESSLQSVFPESAATLLALDSVAAHLDVYSTTAPAVQVDPTNIAYLLYTSGSTGTPKGVMVQHRSVINLSTALHEAVYQGWGDGLRVSVNAPLVFDGSVKQWIQLLRGHTLYPIPEEVRAEATKLVRYLAEHRVEVLDCTPSLLKRLLPAGLLTQTALRGALVGGEAIDSPTWVQLAASKTIDFVNVYGPTEATVDATASHSRHAPDQPAIGHPIANVRVYVLDAALQPVRDGERGELFLAGAGLARGYWNQPALTADQFLPDPFSSEAGARMYRTGDVARWHSDNGGFAYEGRTDDQVQVQGVRIELGEIDALLVHHPLLQAATVVVREVAPSEAHLVAYLVPVLTAPADVIAQVRADLRRQLPLPMMPRYFVRLTQLPLTPNGKVDRHALPLPDLHEVDIQRSYVAPRNEMERVIAGIWQEVLGVEKVGLHDNFWDLGGQSLLLVQAFDRLQAATSKELSLVEMYRHPTVSTLAHYLTEGQTANTLDKDTSPAVSDRVKKQKEALERQRQQAGKRNRQR